MTLMKRICLLLVILSFFCFNNGVAQVVISTSGNHFKAEGKQLSWTIGEPIIESIGHGSYYLTQGFHQGNLNVIPVSNLPIVNVNIKAYPNPATSVVNLSIESGNTKNWSYLLYSSDGRLLQNKSVESQITKIPMHQYAHSNYILKVIENDYAVKTFKIIKTQ